MMGRSNVLYVVMSVSLLFPQCVDVRSFRRLSVFFALVMVLSVWVEYFSLGSKVKQRMVGLEVVGMGTLLMWMLRGLFYSDGSEVLRVDVVLVGSICRLLLWARVCTSLRYGKRFWVAVLVLGWDDVMVMSSA